MINNPASLPRGLWGEYLAVTSVTSTRNNTIVPVGITGLTGLPVAAGKKYYGELVLRIQREAAATKSCIYYLDSLGGITEYWPSSYGSDNSELTMAANLVVAPPDDPAVGHINIRCFFIPVGTSVSVFFGISGGVPEAKDYRVLANSFFAYRKLEE